MSAESPVAQPPFRLGPWLVEPDLNRLSDGKGTVQLEPKVMDVLAVLARNAGGLTTRSELLEEVWGNAYLGEDPTTRAVLTPGMHVPATLMDHAASMRIG